MATPSFPRPPPELWIFHGGPRYAERFCANDCGNPRLILVIFVVTWTRLGFFMAVPASLDGTVGHRPMPRFLGPEIAFCHTWNRLARIVRLKSQTVINQQPFFFCPDSAFYGQIRSVVRSALSGNFRRDAAIQKLPKIVSDLRRLRLRHRVAIVVKQPVSNPASCNNANKISSRRLSLQTTLRLPNATDVTPSRTSHGE